MGEREAQGTAVESVALPHLCGSLRPPPPQTLSGFYIPSWLCGHSWLYSILHAAIFRRASNRF